MAKSSSVVSFRDVSFAGHLFEVADVDHHLSNIQLYYVDPHGQRIGTLEKLPQNSAASGRSLLFATNAGMFNPDFSPCRSTVARAKATFISSPMAYSSSAAMAQK